MGFFAELFRVEDWRSTRLLISVPILAFCGVGVLMTVVLILVQWPGDSWRTLLALLTGSAAASLSRWILLRRQRSRTASVETSID